MSDALLQQAILAIKAGDQATGHKLLAQALAINRANEQAWLWLTQTDITRIQKIKSLQRVLEINPDSEIAKAGLARLQGHAPPQGHPTAGKTSVSSEWLDNLTSVPLALIIEDYDDIAKIFAEALQGAGFETEIIPDGKTALARLASLTPDVVTLDLSLPYVSGKEILQHIRADTRLTKTRVILATSEPWLAESLRPQVDLVLIKPVDFAQLQDLASRLRPDSHIK